MAIIGLAATVGALLVAFALSSRTDTIPGFDLASAKDEYYGFAAGGVSGRINVLGLPSMRLLKTIEPFRDFGYSKSDLHEPVFSLTNGKPDGRKLYVNDKIHNAVAEIDLRTFRTTRVVELPTVKGTHHIAVTPDNKYIFTTGEFSGQIGVIDVATFTAVKEIFVGDPQLQKEAKVADDRFGDKMSLPGKDSGHSNDDAHGHSHALETAASCVNVNSATDYITASPRGDYVVATDRYRYSDGTSRLHIIDIRTLELVKSIVVGAAPHGVDISPDGVYALVSDKLSGTMSIIDLNRLEKVKTIKVGSGPLHAVYTPDNKFVYVTLYIDHKIVEIDMETLELTGRAVDVEWAPGHLAITPDGKYLVSLNKESRDKYSYVGLVFPENFQLIDRASLKVVREVPIDPEPHNMKIIARSTIAPHVSGSTRPPREPGVYREEGITKVYLTMQHFKFDPAVVRVKKGDRVKISATNLDDTLDVSHGFALQEYGINLVAGAGETVEAEFIADKQGMFTSFCSMFCGPLHLEMTGLLVVEED